MVHAAQLAGQGSPAAGELAPCESRHACNHWRSEVLRLVRAGAVKCAAVYQSPHPALRIEYAEVSLLGNRTDNQDRVSVAVSRALGPAGRHRRHGWAFRRRAGRRDRASRCWSRRSGTRPQPILDPLGFLHLSLGRAHEEVAKLGANLPLELRPRATCAVAWCRTAARSGRTSATAASIFCGGARCSSARATTATSSSCCARA